MQIGKSIASEKLWRHWEDQEWRFKRHQDTLQWEEFCSQVLRQVIWRRIPKNDKNRRNWAKEAIPCSLGTCHAPWAHSMHLGHCLCALGIVHVPWAFENVRGACVILCIFYGSAHVFSKNSVKISHCKYSLPHLER